MKRSAKASASAFRFRLFIAAVPFCSGLTVCTMTQAIVVPMALRGKIVPVTQFLCVMAQSKVCHCHTIVYAISLAMVGTVLACVSLALA